MTELPYSRVQLVQNPNIQKEKFSPAPNCSIPSPYLVETTSLPIVPVLGNYFAFLSEENLVPEKCSFSFGKKEIVIGPIVKPPEENALECSVMESSFCLTIPTLLAKLKNCCKSSSGKSEEKPHYSTNLASNLGSKHLSGTRFSRQRCENSCLELAQWAES
ncbi:hypothetical protein AVEN_236026-1 [Araneus ventricosus]|uniref:Uncharacterized protein n=1 Tax=Araneus ventricosus TaxID=182803 RepID=A0A4Y2LAR6_ARAVE|nr:hypothetical protein AVEN_236026-1 [Araneus ventricosus]